MNFLTVKVSDFNYICNWFWREYLTRPAGTLSNWRGACKKNAMINANYNFFFIVCKKNEEMNSETLKL